MSSFNPIKGAPPSIEWQSVDALLVDESYQRTADGPQSVKLIQGIAEDWDWRLCAPLTVAKRSDDRLFVIDGQHRLEAAKLRGDIAHLPVIISRFSSLVEEAQCFVTVNTARKNPTPLDKFHARCIAGDEEALEIKEIVESCGLQVGRRSWSYEPKDVSCVAVLTRCFRSYGRVILSASLVNLAEAYPGEALRCGNELIPGICLILLAPPKGFDPDLFVEVLALAPQASWVARACHMKDCPGIEYPDEAFKDAILEAYMQKVERLAIA